MSWKQYRRTNIAEMRPYVPGESLEGVSVAAVDDPTSDHGMVARNPMNHADQWYVARAYFEANFEPVEEAGRGVMAGLNDYAAEAHKANEKWWLDLKTGQRIARNKGELLCLIHSEISEAMEGERKGLMNDKLPHRRMAEVELADALIRIFDYAGAFGYDLEGAYREKMAFNARRKDHTHEARASAGGKLW